ncbi:MAG: NHL repeat-containing protein, partial [Candidatus Eisenbacteria bacterium]|nr:NHL repeat-containing protein [Candidatus Eisenbacteria bacterium]
MARALRRLTGVLGFALACVLSLVGAAFAPAPAIASLPPYAEQWFTPGQPEDVDVDVYGRVWVARSDDSVRVYSSRGGQLLFSFGGSGEGDGQFHDPFGIQFAPDGTVYICDYAGTRVERFTSEGDFLLSWPIPSDRADHVAIDDLGDVYVTGFSNGFIHKYDAVGNPVVEWPSVSGGRPSGVLVMGGILYVVPWDVYEIEQYALDGTYLGSFPIETAFGVDLEQDALGQLWLADWTNGVLRVYTADGQPVEVLGEFGSDPGQFNGPAGIAFGTEGSVYVADQLNGRIQ